VKVVTGVFEFKSLDGAVVEVCVKLVMGKAWVIGSRREERKEARQKKK
jgi:glucan phosphorylase